jgi:hypothetical protein
MKNVTWAQASRELAKAIRVTANMGDRMVEVYHRLMAKYLNWITFNPSPDHSKVGGKTTVGHIAWKANSNTEAGFSFELPDPFDLKEFGKGVFRFNDPGKNGKGVFKLVIPKRRIYFIDQDAYLAGDVVWGDYAPITKLVILDDRLLEYFASHGIN